MKKTLYFEGAGMNTYESGEDVGNHRIRTAFLNNEGKAICLEIIGHKFNNKKCNHWQSHIDYVFYIPGSEDEEKKYLHFDNFKKEGYTIIPLSMFIGDGGFAKLEIALAKGKKLFDKRDDIAKKSQTRDMQRAMKR